MADAHNLTDDERATIREAINGDADEPVVLQTSPAGGGTTDGTDGETDGGGHGLSVSAEDVVEQLQKHDPMLLELLALRAVVGRL